MGCPAKKVCNKAAGSALLKDEQLVADILQATVAAVDLPVTLKIRTGWDTENRNGETIARIAEDAGIKALAVHGRTRACGYRGEAEYDTIAAIRKAIDIPLYANGDINSAKKARQILDYTGADAVMLGRAAQGNPWIFSRNKSLPQNRESITCPRSRGGPRYIIGTPPGPVPFYGDYLGIRIARKHVGWYLKDKLGVTEFRKEFNQLEETAPQQEAIRAFFFHPGSGCTCSLSDGSYLGLCSG